MKKPIIFVFYISIACCIGFVGGFYFSGFYNKDIVSETISKSRDFDNLFDLLKLVIYDENVLKDLDTVNAIGDVEAIKDKYRKNGLKNIRLFKKHASSMKKNAANPSVIAAFEKNLEITEKYFMQGTP